MSAQYVTLKECVGFALDEFGKSDKDMDKCWLFAFRALRQLNQMIAADPKTVRLPVSANKTVPLPADYISWSKIGVVNDRGEVASLRVNTGLTLFRDNNPNRLSSLTPDVSDGFNGIYNAPLYFNYYNNGSFFNLFGVYGGLIQYGDCRVDEANNVIVLSPQFQYPDIILEYISNPQKDEDYKIESCLQEAVIAFIGWKLKVKPREDFYNAAIEGRRSLTNKRVTLQQINQVIRQATGMYLKS